LSFREGKSLIHDKCSYTVAKNFADASDIIDLFES
jgi:hypothetical protein